VEKFSCCFCGKAGVLPEALQLVVFEQREVDSGQDDPPSQQFYAHRTCLEAAVTPQHRIFMWDDDGAAS
jgi:hypothetical protein